MASMLHVCLSFTFVLIMLAGINADHQEDVTEHDDVDFKHLIKNSLQENEKYRNVMKMLAMDVDDFQEEKKQNKLCDLIKELQPSLVGLQALDVNGLLALKRCFSRIKVCDLPTRGELRKRHSRRRSYRKCGGYEIIGSASSTADDVTFFNPVIFRGQRALRPLGQNGTFWLSETPDSPFTGIEGANGFHTCSWMKLRFGVDTGRPTKETPLQSNFLEFLIKTLRKARRQRRTTKWVDFYFVNTQLDDNSELAKRQMEILLKHLKDNILPVGSTDPVILTGGSNADDLSSVFTLLSNENFKNSVTTARRFDTENISAPSEPNFIWARHSTSLVSSGVEAVEGDLEGLLSAMLFE